MFGPIVKYEMSVQQSYEVNKEKQSIYEPCISKLIMKHMLKTVKVIGLFIRARGTIT